MAKSIRSKWKRKCRAVKRERYGKKELERLKKTLGITDNVNNIKVTSAVGEIANVKTANEVKDIKGNKGEGMMDTDDTSKKFDLRTLRDKNGAYPVWLHPRKIKKAKSKKKVKKAKGKKNNKKS